MRLDSVALLPKVPIRRRHVARLAARAARRLTRMLGCGSGRRRGYSTNSRTVCRSIKHWTGVAAAGLTALGRPPVAFYRASNASRRPASERRDRSEARPA